MHIGFDYFFSQRILHEFGHHVEERGPVEVWCALASFLAALSNGRPLDPEVQGFSRTPTYGRDPEGVLTGVPNYYSLSYYEDAGTELVALALENNVPDSPNTNVDWVNGKTSYDPRYMAALLQALRPNAYIQKGLTLPALLK